MPDRQSEIVSGDALPETSSELGPVSELRVQRILLVDDEDIVRRVLALLLRRAGFEVVEARGGVEALTLISEFPPDLVLTDLNMPDMAGDRVCVAIKRDPTFARVPVVLMTGGPVDESRFHQMGCAAILYKPLPLTLGVELSKILSSQSSPDATRTSSADGR